MVRGVQCLEVADAFQIHQVALTLVKSQRTAYDVSKFAAKWHGPAVTEVDWHWFVAKMAEAPTVKELRRMSGVEKWLMSVLRSTVK